VHGFAALNTALAGDGAVVRLARGAAAEHPVHLLFYATARKQPTLAQPRNLIVADDGSSATVVEHYAGEPGATYLRNAATEIALGRDAALVHVKVQAESESGYHVHRIQAYQNAGSSFTSHAIALGGALSRTEIATTLDGEGAGCALLGLYVVQGSQHVDHHTTIDHAKPRTTSRELYKGILDESSRGVFTGKVLVRKDAQQISAEQTNRNLLLADGAQVETRPQLEIYADDVKCTHGAAVGRLDEDALFYMRQRGIDPAQARSLLTYGFASEVLAELGIDDLREALEQTVLARVRRASEGRNA
jgi:Fe-S cluster assembly protein SufD